MTLLLKWPPKWLLRKLPLKLHSPRHPIVRIHIEGVHHVPSQASL
jgi:hypothetical protein